METQLWEQTHFTTADRGFAQLQLSIPLPDSSLHHLPNPNFFSSPTPLPASYFTQVSLQEFCYGLQEGDNFTRGFQIFTMCLQDRRCLKPASNFPVPAGNRRVGGRFHVTGVPAGSQAGTGPELSPGQSPPGSRSSRAGGLRQTSILTPNTLSRPI